jgi:hypothetical protein
MAYESVDRLQKALCESVFHYAKDTKKAAGRALGTLVEIIAFYLFQAWGLEDHIAIERRLPEYPDGDISHTVEYSFHPSRQGVIVEMPASDLPISSAKIRKAIRASGYRLPSAEPKTNTLLTSDRVLRNGCVIAEGPDGFVVARLSGVSSTSIAVSVQALDRAPFAMAECKRVGIEEGAGRGPQTIEKAKQGAYVARSVSSLQRIRLADGGVGGIMQRADGSLVHMPYETFLEKVIASDDADLLRQFVLTVGIVSNHGNWFTSDDHNKELRVLARSYDWLLFLTDEGLSEFVTDLLIQPSAQNAGVRQAFTASYTGHKGVNRFTKVKIDSAADALLREYFAGRREQVEGWFNVIAPSDRALGALHDELHILAGKRWDDIRQ